MTWVRSRDGTHMRLAELKVDTVARNLAGRGHALRSGRTNHEAGKVVIALQLLLLALDVGCTGDVCMGFAEYPRSMMSRLRTQALVFDYELPREEQRQGLDCVHSTGRHGATASVDRRPGWAIVRKRAKNGRVQGHQRRGDTLRPRPKRISREACETDRIGEGGGYRYLAS